MTLGPVLDRPSPQNRYQQDFIARLVGAFARVTGADLVAQAGLDPAALGESAWHGDFALLTHRGGADAVLNYGNLFVQKLWAADWTALTALPSALTAPQEGRETRAAMMAQVAARGFVTGYAGERIAADGRRFIIRDGIVWRLQEKSGEPFGVAAFFKHYTPL
jgi:hypothetical protein